MAQPVIQTAFHAGEWAPPLNARVDLAKYHSAAALMENFFVDYRGGASTRAGTKYILRCMKSSSAVRLITFQASFDVGYVLELGDYYMRVYNDGSPVLETGISITGVTKANPCVVSVTNSYSVGDWVYISGCSGMTELNNQYYIITAATGSTITLSDLYGTAVNSSAYGTWTSGGTTARVYTLSMPYAATDLNQVKFAQDINKMVFCHPDYVPYVLTLVSAINWTMLPIAFGTSASTPTGVAVTSSLSAGSVNYAYVVTAVDAYGQESSPSSAAALASKTDLRTVAGTNTVSWTAAEGAVNYNVYKAQLRYGSAVPAGAQMGFIGNCTGLNFIDSNITPDYSITPPISQNPFQGAGVEYVTVGTAGTYTSVPTVTFSAAPTGGSTATGSPVLQITAATLSTAGGNFTVGQAIGFPNGVTLIVASVDAYGVITGFEPLTYPGTSKGAISSGSTPTNPVSMTVVPGHEDWVCKVNFTWGVGYVTLVYPGTGYTSTPTLAFSSGAAAATAVLAESSAGNPAVPGYFGQRLFLGCLANSPSEFHMSKVASDYNFDYSNPIRADDAISGRLRSGQLNTIKYVVPMPSGLVVLCDRQAWVLNGGQGSTALSPIDIQANPQAYNGCSDVQPLISNFDILYVQAKGSIVRDLSYNFYTNIFTGVDITALSSHLFYGYTITDWTLCEEPFKIIWAVRDDGQMLSLTFMKEQELIGWAHHTTDGDFKSATSVVEAAAAGKTDALYVVVERTINGQTVKYVERMVDRIFPDGVVDAWCVDAGLQYSGSAATSFSGAEHLAGATVTGLADGVVIPAFTMPSNGRFTLAAAASKVTVGLAYTAMLKTLALNLGEPTVQGKRKREVAVTIRLSNALGLQIGRTLDTLVDMQDLIVGNLGSVSGETVSDLITGDARTIIDPLWDTFGQYYIVQPSPLPASVLGVIPEVIIGDTPK